MELTDAEKGQLLGGITGEILGGRNVVAEAKAELSKIERKQNLAARTQHINPEQARKEDLERKRNHSTHGNPQELPTDWTSTGQKPPIPGLSQ